MPEVAKADGPALSGATSNDAANTVTGMAAGMEFSINGTTWTAYNETTPNLPILTGTVALQVRVAETANREAGAAATFYFTVPTLSGIAITTQATKTAYKVGDTLSIAGMVVTGTYSDSTTKPETVGAGDVTGFNSAAVAVSQTLTVTVGGKTATYTISVAKADGPALSGITSSDAANTVTGMTAAMEFSTDGSTWTAYNETTPNLPGLTGTVALQVRVAETATHEAGAATTFNFTVPTLENIAITIPATKLAYKVGDTLSIAGMVVTGTYSDATTKPETVGAGDVTGFNSAAVAATQTLTVTVGGKTTTYTVTIVAIPITAIAAITGTPQVGEVLTAGALTPSGATIMYQWEISTDGDGTRYVGIGAATLSTYTPIPGDAGKYIHVVATGTGSYTGTVQSAATTVVTDALAQVAQPTWSGDTINWVDVANETTYDVQLYKGGVASGAAVNVVAGTITYDFAAAILTASGTYTVTVTAKGNGLPYTDGTPSIASAGNVRATISDLALNTLVTAPVTGVAPSTTAINATQYTGTIEWFAANGTTSVSGNFAASTVYVGKVTLAATTGYTLTGVTSNSFTYTGATATNAANAGVVTITFPATASSDATITGGALEGVALTGNFTGGTNIGASTELTVTVFGGEANDIFGLIKGNANSVINYIVGSGTPATDAAYALTYGTTTIDTTVTPTIIWLLVTSEDTTTKLYYKITATAASSDAALSGGSLGAVSFLGSFAGGTIGSPSELTVTVSPGTLLLGLESVNTKSAIWFATSLSSAPIDSGYNHLYSAGTQSIQITVSAYIWVRVTAEDGITKLYYRISVLVPTVGQSYGGGIVAYIFVSGDIGYVAGQTHGLIAATADQNSGNPIVWAIPTYQSTLVGGTLMTVGSGAANTGKIINVYGTGTDYAAGICDAYINNETGTGVYTDWYLPSLSDLQQLYNNRDLIKNFTTGYYWSSSETSSTNAYGRNFINGTGSNGPKSTTEAYVRPVRAF